MKTDTNTSSVTKSLGNINKFKASGTQAPLGPGFPGLKWIRVRRDR